MATENYVTVAESVPASATIQALINGQKGGKGCRLISQSIMEIYSHYTVALIPAESSPQR